MNEKIEKTKFRTYSDDIEDGDIELVMKEWKLAGFESMLRGKYLVVYDPELSHQGLCYYQKIGDSWRIVDVQVLNQLEGNLAHKIRSESVKDPFTSKLYRAGQKTFLNESVNENAEFLKSIELGKDKK